MVVLSVEQSYGLMLTWGKVRKESLPKKSVYVNQKPTETLKFIASRDIVSQMHISIVRPQLEYPFEVWSGCTKSDIENLEEVQLHAARIATDLSTLAFRNSLHLDTGGTPLALQRARSLLTKHKTMLFHVKDTLSCIRNTTLNITKLPSAQM